MAKRVSSASFISAATTARSWSTPTKSHAPAMTYFATAAKFAHYATYGKSGSGSSTQ